MVAESNVPATSKSSDLVAEETVSKKQPAATTASDRPTATSAAVAPAIKNEAQSSFDVADIEKRDGPPNIVTSSSSLDSRTTSSSNNKVTAAASNKPYRNNANNMKGGPEMNGMAGGSYHYPHQHWVGGNGAGYGGPPPYGYHHSGGGPNGPYGGPPPGHYHPSQMHHQGQYHPHQHHPHMMPPPHPHYNAGGPGNGNFQPQQQRMGMPMGNYPPQQQYGGHPNGYPSGPSHPPSSYGMNQPYNMPYPMMPSARSTDAASVTSNRSKSSKSSLRKRTIDGMATHNDRHIHHSLPQSMPPAYQFRRSESNCSTASTMTTANNTSMETQATDDNSSTSKRVSNGMAGLPPIFGACSFGSDNVEDASNGTQPRHRRNHSADSTASSLSAGGFSLESYEGARGNGKFTSGQVS
jgi:hypothetical protein